MAYVNEHYLKLSAGYLFPEIARRVNAREASGTSGRRLIRMGIGDVTEPLPPAVVQALHAAVDEMGSRDTFRGYGPEQGYGFLREKIAEHDYAARGVRVSPEEIFVSDGSKCDCANILDVLGHGNTVAVADPVYPVYVDTNVMAGHTTPAGPDGRYGGLVYLPATRETGFLPPLPDAVTEKPVDVVYLCFPNNPTGAVAGRDVLKSWVDYARANDTLLLFDAAYEAFITDPDVPRSIYEIEGARECAVEFRSFSKTAGFTGLRAAFTVVPEGVRGRLPGGEWVGLHGLWKRRQTTKFNGISYVVQRGAEAVYSEQGRRQVHELVDFYGRNARLLRDGLTAAGLDVFGGLNAPYVWAACPAGKASWDYFDLLLNQADLVCTPGSGFGKAGEGYVRFSAFNSRENVEEALGRIRDAGAGG